jgi:hypothetical protein
LPRSQTLVFLNLLKALQMLCFKKCENQFEYLRAGGMCFRAGLKHFISTLIEKFSPQSNLCVVAAI